MPTTEAAEPHLEGLDSSAALSFGAFQLLPSQKQLLEGEQSVRLGSRAMELLVALVEQAGEIVSREELEARVWPRTVVEETSLRVHVSSLRKALRDGQDGHRYITNIPGRGYCFVAPVTASATRAAISPPAVSKSSAASDALPPRVARMIGRADITTTLCAQLEERRFLSIVGTGGIGKTTVALAVASRQSRHYDDGVRFVDLAPLADPQLVIGAIAIAVGFPLSVKVTLPLLCGHLANRRMLIVLDNCEHVIAAAAGLAESIVRAAPDLHVLATSREPLFAEGEWVHRLAPLQGPLAGEPLTVEQALQFPAVQLFVERAMAATADFKLSADTLPAVRQLCYQLDGIPLAIELAAARVSSLGVHDLAQRLNELFRLLSHGRRTALSRHRAIEALLDWSHELLTPTERLVLSRLSVFRSGFTLDSAAQVASDAQMSPEVVKDTVLALTAKSLVQLDSNNPAPRYRLLYMTREYAGRRFAQSADNAAVRMRHARHLCDLCESANATSGDTAEAQRASDFARLLDDIRAALVWAYSPEGDDATAVRLTASLRTRTFNLGLGEEDRDLINRGLERVTALSPPQPLLELQLCIAWCFLSGHTDGIASMQPGIFARTLELADLPQARPLRMEALYSVAIGSLGQGRFQQLDELAQRAWAIAAPEDAVLGVLMGGRMQVFADHYLGRHASALNMIERVVRQPIEPRHRRFGAVPHNSSMGHIEARIHWMQGDTERALNVIEQVLRDTEGGHPFAKSQALALGAIPIAIWSGDAERASQWVDALQDHADRGAIGFWHSWVPAFRYAIQKLATADGTTGFAPMRDWQLPVNWSAQDLLGTLSEDLATESTVERVESGAVGWCGPEILRAHGENLLRREGPAGAGAAQALFVRALEMARQQGARAWELRVEGSLARLNADMRASLRS